MAKLFTYYKYSMFDKDQPFIFVKINTAFRLILQKRLAENFDKSYHVYKVIVVLQIFNKILSIR